MHYEQTIFDEKTSLPKTVHIKKNTYIHHFAFFGHSNCGQLDVLDAAARQKCPA